VDAPSRTVTHRYADPLDVVWLEAARRIGLTIARSDVAYAWFDGRGTLTLGSPDTLDADDCLAQMIFHELCHSLVQGPDSLEQPDWGLDNETDRDLHREHACLRAQAWIAGRYGLRDVLAPTTDHRAFFDALPPDPLLPRPGVDPALERRSIELARVAITRADRFPWAPHLTTALEATQRIVAASAPHAPMDSLFARHREPASRHPTGLFAHPDPSGRTCGECAWQRPIRGRPRCLHASAPIDPSWTACERFEPALDCQACGACCREAYERVELSTRDPFVRAHPELVRRIDGRLVLQRVDGRCPALEGDGPYACTHYDERPRTCRDFTRGSDNCRDARRRVGLSL
jgi:hypothetical protein